MLVVQSICDRNHLVVKTFLPRFFTANQQNRGAPRIEGKERPVRPPVALKTHLSEQSNAGVDIGLGLLVNSVPPFLELVGELDLPCHEVLCLRRYYSVKDIELCQE